MTQDAAPARPARLPAQFAGKFIVQDATHPRTMTLSGNQQLIWEAAESEDAYSHGGPVTPRFLRTVDSIARSILGLQVGLALGGGAPFNTALYR